MPRILFINPVGHPTWDEKDKAFLQARASPGTVVDVVSLPKGPASVERAEDHAEAIPLVVARVRELEPHYDAFVVNCFMDPGVEEAQEVTTKPVIGAATASVLFASSLGGRVGVVTVGSRETLRFFVQRLRQRGLDRFVYAVTTIEIGVLDLERSWGEVLNRIEKAVASLEEQGVEAVALGCTGLAGAAEEVSSRVGIPVVDPAVAGLKMAESLVALRMRNPRSRVSTYVGGIQL